MSFYKFTIEAFRCFSKIFYKYEVIGAENIPNEGNLIIAANHKSNLDAIFIAAAIQKEKLHLLEKKNCLIYKILGYLLNKLNVIPINRDKPDVSTIKNILRAIKRWICIRYISRRNKSKEPGFGEAKAGLSIFAIKGKALVVPVSIITNYKLFNRVTIYIDKPISFEEYYKEKLNSQDYERLITKCIRSNKGKLLYTL